MKDVSEKLNTLRQAVAKASIKSNSETIKKVKDGDVPKGNVLEMARAAGILAAKKTSELIPYCHQIPLDWVTVDFEILKEEIVINTQVKAIWKTGVEMEALTAASVAALTIYDMLKPLDENLEINSVKLLEKRGGKSELKQQFNTPLKVAVLVLSDTVSEGKKEDKSGKMIIEKLEHEPVEILSYKILPDELNLIKDELINLSDKEKIDLILTTGGTGLSSSDVTVEATKEVIEREVTGISEAIRIYGFERTPYAMLSRGIAGVRGETIIINLPGSSRGVAESINALFPWVLHSFWVMKGGGHNEK
ncbi:MAG: bifunctional molybdenum cofactor biosynthesis protein MoaC/MoaB [Candidatus Dadabacteria bacterium]|nr:bifunctional molybdenum cofactor biosynthesis protein MoaC/MoaB [Candidatus Dadabacteria bacterium]